MLLAAGFLSCASSSAPAGSRVEFYPSNANISPVYKITKDGNVMFLAGSVHVLRDNDFPLPEAFDYAFSASDILVIETDIDQMEDPEIQQHLLYSSFFTDGRTLSSVLSPQTFALLSQACNDYGFPINENVMNLKPSMVVNILTVMQIQELGFAKTGVDEFYYNKAKNENKPVDFLESIQSQINIITTMGEGYEDEYVLYSLQDMDSTEDSIQAMVFEWKNGITSLAEESITELIAEWPMLYRSMLTDRHDEWFPQLDKFLASGKTHFVIAGFLHLPGPYGLLQYLENSGCTVEQIAVR